MKKQINPVIGVIAVVVILVLLIFAGYKLFLQPTPNEPVDASPYTKAFNENMKKAFANKSGTPGNTAQDTPMQPRR